MSDLSEGFTSVRNEDYREMIRELAELRRTKVALEEEITRLQKLLNK